MRVYSYENTNNNNKIMLFPIYNSVWCNCVSPINSIRDNNKNNDSQQNEWQITKYSNSKIKILYI